MRLIDADALADKFKTIYMDVENVAISHRVITSVDLMLAPTIDAEPVRHGRWIVNNVVIDNNGRTMPDWPKCSECGTQNDLERNYCPNCGAKMDLEVQDD